MPNRYLQFEIYFVLSIPYIAFQNEMYWAFAFTQSCGM